MMQIETIIKQGENKFRGESKAKTMRGWINGMIQSFSRKGNTELEFIFREILNAYNRFHPEKIIQVEVKSWKGKSSFELIKGIDKLIIIKYQKRDKNSESIEMRTEVSRRELQSMINSILRLKSLQTISTDALSVVYSEMLNLNHSGWKTGDNPIFCDRNFHNKYTLILGALDSLDLIKYSGGKIELLEKEISIQMIL